MISPVSQYAVNTTLHETDVAGHSEHNAARKTDVAGHSEHNVWLTGWRGIAYSRDSGRHLS